MRDIETISTEELLHMARGIARGDYPKRYPQSLERKLIGELANRLTGEIMTRQDPRQMAPALLWYTWNETPPRPGKYLVAVAEDGRQRIKTQLFVDRWNGKQWAYINPRKITAWAII